MFYRNITIVQLFLKTIFASSYYVQPFPMTINRPMIGPDRMEGMECDWFTQIKSRTGCCVCVAHFDTFYDNNKGRHCFSLSQIGKTEGKMIIKILLHSILLH